MALTIVNNEVLEGLDYNRWIDFNNELQQGFYSDIEVYLEIVPIVEVIYGPYNITGIHVSTTQEGESTITINASSTIKVILNSDNSDSFTGDIRPIETNI